MGSFIMTRKRIAALEAGVGHIRDHHLTVDCTLMVAV